MAVIRQQSLSMRAFLSILANRPPFLTLTLLLQHNLHADAIKSHLVARSHYLGISKVSSVRPNYLVHPLNMNPALKVTSTSYRELQALIFVPRRSQRGT